MTSLDLLHSALVLHIIGLTMVVGATLSDYVAFKQFWKQYRQDKQKGVAVLQALSRFPRIIGIGFVIIILTGVTMMAIMHGAFGTQLWFRIKMIIVLLVIGGGLLVGRRNGIRLRTLVATDSAGTDQTQELYKVKSRIGSFHIVQLLLFVLIFILSVFRFV